MSFLDSVRHTLGEAATTARDVGQNLGAQAQAQLQLRKLQLEQTRKLHELGARAYDWHRAGQLVATGQVPREVQELCIQLDDLGAQISVETHKLEEARRQAELRAAKGEPVEAIENPTQETPMNTFTTTAANPIAAAPPSPMPMPMPMPTSSTPPIASMPTTEPTVIIPISTMPVSTMPSETSGSYALIPGPDMTPPVMPSPSGPDANPPVTPPSVPGAPGPDIAPPTMPPPSGPNTNPPMPPSPPLTPPSSPGSMPTM